jgi:hypothetical protein
MLKIERFMNFIWKFHFSAEYKFMLKLQVISSDYS